MQPAAMDKVIYAKPLSQMHRNEIRFKNRTSNFKVRHTRCVEYKLKYNIKNI